MTPEDKLEKVEELLAARDEITTELLELLGATDDGEEEEVEAPRRGRPKKEETIASNAPHTRAPRGACHECGSTGSRHFKTCQQANPVKSGGNDAPVGDRRFKEHDKVMADFTEKMNDEPEGRTILDEPERFTEQEYKDVHASFADGLSPSEIAFSFPHIERLEIRKAVDAETYREYLAS